MREKSGMLINILEQEGVLQKLVCGNKEIECFAQDVRSKKNIFIVGTGASLNAAYACIVAFTQFAGIVPCVIPAAEIDYYLHVFNEDSAVILISQSGDSFETKMMCEFMQNKNLPFWGITNEANSTLAKKATSVLFMNAEKEVSSATKTYTATLLLLYLVAAFGNESALKALEEIPNTVKSTIDECESKIEKLAETLKDCKSIYVLGDNINSATARAGALLLKEKNLIMAEGMTASEFRHGAVEVCKPGLEFIIIAPTKANWEEVKKHISFLKSLNCNVTLIAPQNAPGVEEYRYLQVAGAPLDCVSQLAATIPMQLLTEKIANIIGLDVDGFLYLSKVVGKY